MPLCHQCQHNREIERLRAACLACRGPSDKFGRDTHIVSEACLYHVMKHQAPDYTRTPSAALVLNGVTPDARDAMLDALHAFTMLTDGEAAVLRRLMRGEHMIDISRTLGVTKQSIHDRWKRILSKGPIFRSLANGFIGLRRGATKAEREAKAAQRAQAARDANAAHGASASAADAPTPQAVTSSGDLAAPSAWPLIVSGPLIDRGPGPAPGSAVPDR